MVGYTLNNGIVETYWISMAPDAGASRVVLIDAISRHHAVARIHELGLYVKGEEFLVFVIPQEEPELGLPRDRVLTVEELESVGAKKLGDVDPDLS